MVRTWLILGFTLLLAACSAVKLVYNQLDWAIPLYVNNLVALDDTQGERLRADVTELLRWHCATQVSDYAQTLRTINADFQSGRVSRARLAAHHEQILAYWQAIRVQTAPRLTELLASASDAQVDELFDNFAEQNRKFRSEHVDLPENKLRENAEETMRERIEDWTGNLTAGQQRAVHAWSRGLALNGAERLAWRQHWQAEMRRALAARSDRQRFVNQMRPLIVHTEQLWPAPYREKYVRIREQTLTLLVEIGSTLEPEQLEHMARRTDRWAEAFEGLACAAPPSPGTAAATPISAR
jgi:hypothetical protein